ncbi:hypothetical protein Thiowin_03555 [Thiorhodovibrio winogradskyi]|uniref:Uncharacterized protein n=1 Tax=Thiorhodovibrio winogradskyi TaxID=77007 RepID=A0ABZ0SC70_9GAMM
MPRPTGQNARLHLHSRHIGETQWVRRGKSGKDAIGVIVLAAEQFERCHPSLPTLRPDPESGACR